MTQLDILLFALVHCCLLLCSLHLVSCQSFLADFKTNHNHFEISILTPDSPADPYGELETFGARHLDISSALTREIPSEPPASMPANRSEEGNKKKSITSHDR